MILLRKLHIKILSLAFLVTLVSYNALENRLLPQQFVNEFVVGEQSHGRCAFYSTSVFNKAFSGKEYTKFNFRSMLLNFNTIQSTEFKMANSNSETLKELRTANIFSSLIIVHNDERTEVI